MSTWLGYLFKMCVVCVSVITVASLIAPTPAPVVQNNINEYTITKKACSKSKVNNIENNKICIKVNNKYRWATINNNPIHNKEETKAVDFEYNICSNDPKIPEVWKNMEQFFIKHSRCNSPYRIEKKLSYLGKPMSEVSNNHTNPDYCKITQNRKKNNRLAFPKQEELRWFNSSNHPGPSTVYQIVPIFTSDSGKPENSPLDDYGAYFEFIKEWTKYTSDTTSSVEFRVPQKYFYVKQKLSSLNINHTRSSDDAEKINKAIINDTDKYINFNGTNIVIFLVPPSTDINLVDQVGLHRAITDEGEFISSIFPPLNLKVFSEKTSHFVQPSWWLHELFHVGIGFDDNKQDGFDGNTGSWGLINRYSAGDLFTWHKWIAGFISDNQVMCFTDKDNFTSWIRPSSYKTSESKMIVVKISDTKALFIESIRPYNLNYKINKDDIGVRVLLVDTDIIDSHDGIRSLLSSKNNKALKSGDFIIYNNKKISVIESGEFGDVVRVENIGL